MTPLVLGIVLGLGFLLLLVALQAPLAAALGVATNLLAVGAAFGVAAIFQDGHGAGVLGSPARATWTLGPGVFFATIFAISMDYTVFLLSSAKEHWERSHDAHDAMVGGLADSGPVIFAAAAVIVAVLVTSPSPGRCRRRRGESCWAWRSRDALLVRLLLLPVLLRLAGALVGRRRPG